MFTLQWTKEAAEQYRELQARAENRSKSSKGAGLSRQVNKTLKQIRENPRHPGLRTHHYYSLSHPYKKGAKVFEAYAQNDTPGAYRVFWCYGPVEAAITIIAITPHP